MTMSLPFASSASSMSALQKDAYDCAMRGRNTCITGPAGCGKSHVLKRFVEDYNIKNGINGIYVTSTTGVSALQIGTIEADGKKIGATTLHAWAGFGLMLDDVDEMLRVVRTTRKKDVKERWLTTKLLVIDEISMANTDMFIKLEEFARRIRVSKYPWGGIQVVVVGDFLQLPPVKRDDQSDDQIEFVFETDTWRKSFFSVFHLTQIFRQGKDPDYAECLNRIRIAQHTDSDIAMIRSRMRAFDESSGDIRPTLLHPYRMGALEENMRYFNKLTTPVYTFHAEDSGNESSIATLDRDCQATKRLELRAGAQVMVLRNISPTVVNGSRAIVVGFRTSESSDPVPIVRFLDGSTMEMPVVDFEIYMGKKRVACRKQIPLALAWAVTIHKAQGLSCDLLEVSLAKAFTFGHVYVALSRATSLNALYVRDFDPSKIRAHPRALLFHENR